MRILILGGTIFLGRHLVTAAIGRGHDVTIFHRGKHPLADPTPGIHEILGDRTDSLDPLMAQTWDAIIDTSGYLPRVVQANAEALQHAASHYIFVSSISVYPLTIPPNSDESFPALPLGELSSEELTDENYGPLKALCEQAVQSVFGEGATIVRPGLIVGPHDPTYRFTYWVERMNRGGEVLAPVGPDEPVQFIDARDLAEWIVHLAEHSTGGVFNATGPDYPLTLGQVLDTARAVTGSDASVTWVSEDFLTAHQVEAWSDLPIWVPQSTIPGFLRVDCRKAQNAGLNFRPLSNTVQSTLDWALAHPRSESITAGLAGVREQDLLKAWHAQAETRRP